MSKSLRCGNSQCRCIVWVVDQKEWVRDWERWRKQWYVTCTGKSLFWLSFWLNCIDNIPVVGDWDSLEIISLLKSLRSKGTGNSQSCRSRFHKFYLWSQPQLFFFSFFSNLFFFHLLLLSLYSSSLIAIFFNVFFSLFPKNCFFPLLSCYNLSLHIYMCVCACDLAQGC